MPTRDKIVTLRLTKDEYRTLEVLADKDMRPLSAYIRVVLMENVPDERRRLGITTSEQASK